MKEQETPERDQGHDKAVDELNRLEHRLIKEIADTDNQLLMDIFLDWQTQRNVCNEEFNKWFENLQKQAKSEAKKTKT